MNKVRAKFRVAKISRAYWDKTGVEILMQPNYDPSIPEDIRFQEATPSGALDMYVTNPKAIEVLQLGKAFYLDLTPVEEDALGNTVSEAN